MTDAGQHPAGNSCRVVPSDDVIPAGFGVQSIQSSY
ncbi:hypothetical protein BOS5A_210872 [Bosea sp. EC-HK365B]|nr:hypothetical protein BOSE7B_120732 [Bosea sp. 7B]CAD5274603.1 hypothetical protein BOSE21B_30181 [Bosea sp. 21B]VVT60081.1 hypothetical protein BOS5A_210872 [Bosea sp. EC-HK365B]